MNTLSAAQVLALAPDEASIKAARGLARPAKWLTLGHDEQALWGECKGSALYQISIDPGEPAFKCSCPSRKLPCKHVLGLLLLAADEPGLLPTGPAPQWLLEWQAKRAQNAQRKAARAGAATELDPEQQAQRAAARDKRASARQRKVEAGLEELERWLRDLIRQGLAQAQRQPLRYWHDMAARLVDAQAPGLARWLRDLGSIPASGEGWSGRLLAQLGQLFLLLEAYRRLDTLPEALQADIRGRIGWTLGEADVPDGNWVRDRWLLLGQYTQEEEQIRMRRAWLWGHDCGRLALLLDFAHQSQTLQPLAAPGSWLEAELGFFPSQYPLRAVLRNACALTAVDGAPPGLADGAALLDAYAGALAQQPWLGLLPARLDNAVPVRRAANAWSLRDSGARLLPCHPGFSQGWPLLALSGGQGLPVFGEWDGQQFRPLGAWVDGAFVAL